MIIPEIYKPLFDDNEKRDIYLFSGRCAGKTYSVADMVVRGLAKHPDKAIVCCRANTNQFKDTLYAEILIRLEQYGLDKVYEGVESQLCIRDKGTKDTVVYFKALQDVTGNRTKGFKTKRKLLYVIVDEAQEIRTELVLRNALSSLKRYLDDNYGRTVIVANGDRRRGYWSNDYMLSAKRKENCKLIEPSYKDIWQLLPKATKDEIKEAYKYNKPLYEFMYLNNLNALTGLNTYYAFTDKNIISEETALQMFEEHGLLSLFIGIDPATVHDSTATSFTFELGNGEVVTYKSLSFDPLLEGSTTTRTRVKRIYTEMLNMLSGLESKGFSGAKEIPKNTIIDCASADFIEEVTAFDLENYDAFRFNPLRFTAKDTVKNTDIANKAFALMKAYVVGNESNAKLIEQLNNVCWKENCTGTAKLDSAIPNDSSDALVYSLRVIFDNPYDL